MLDKSKLEKNIKEILEHAGESKANFSSKVAINFYMTQIMSAVSDAEMTAREEFKEEEFKCDPDLVIHTEPVMIREDKSKPESGMKVEFMGGFKRTKAWKKFFDK